MDQHLLGILCTFLFVLSNLCQALVNINENDNVLQSSSNGVWTKSSAASTYNWHSIDADSTGQYLAVAANNNKGIYMSSDYGSTWIPAGSTLPTIEDYQGVAVNGSGQHIIGVIGGNVIGGIQVSTDFGKTWAAASGASLQYWNSVTLDDSGQNAVAVVSTQLLSSGYIYFSRNGGFSWTESGGVYSSNWNGVTSSASGQNVVAVIDNTATSNSNEVGIYRSTDYGMNFVQVSTLALEFTGVASDCTGQYLVAVSSGGEIYTSQDWGAHWNQAVDAPAYQWNCVASDISGQYLVAAIDGIIYNQGGIYRSTDFGVTWVKTSAPAEDWFGVASDSTGRYLAVASTQDGIWTSNNSVNATTRNPTAAPTLMPTLTPSKSPTLAPTNSPTEVPTLEPSAVPTAKPTDHPTAHPSTLTPSAHSTTAPSVLPSALPSFILSAIPSAIPSAAPSAEKTAVPSATPSAIPSAAPSAEKTAVPSATPSAIPSAAPSAEKTAVPSATPSAIPSAAPSAEKTAVPSATPSAIPSAAPSAEKTAVPSATPSAIPSVAPSAEKTAVPSATPSAIPSAAPSSTTSTAVPTVSPSEQRTVIPSQAPTTVVSTMTTFSPTAEPTIAPSSNSTAFLIVSFTSNVTLTAVSAATLDSASQSSIVATTADVMKIDLTDVSFVNSFVTSTVSLSTSPNRIVPHAEDTFTVVAVTLTQVLMSTTKYPTPDVLYQDLTQALSAAVSDGAYNTALLDFNKLYSATQLTSAQATSVASSPETVSSLSTSPILQPTSAPDQASELGVILEVASTLPGIFIIFVGFAVLHFRRVRESFLNELKNARLEYMDLLFRGVTVSLAVNVLLTTSITTNGYTFVLLLLSRLLIISLCVVFLCFFVFPARNELNQSQGISLLIRTDVLRDNGAITIYTSLIIVSLFELSMLRYLPWFRTPFTKIMDGYPNMFLLRSSLYGTFFSSVIQSCALMPALLASSASSDLNTNVKSVALLVFSLLSMIRSFISIVLHMKKAASVNFKMAIVSEGDVAALAEFVGSVDSTHSSRKRTDMELLDLRPSSVPRSADDISDMLSVARSTNKRSESNTEQHSSNPMHWESSSQLGDDMSEMSEVTEATEEIDDRGIIFATKIHYADQTVDILRDQVRLAGLTPLEFIPLPALKAELERLFDCANNALPYDIERLDYLLLCLEHNPEYKAEQDAAQRAWRAEIEPFLSTSLDEMRAFVPPHIFKSSQSSLMSDEGYSKALAKRLITKKCLWLVRISSRDIDRMHIAELQGRFNPEAQGLDLTETAAIYASLPEQFSRDADRRKARWRGSVEQSLKSLYKQFQAKSLPGPKRRNVVYKGQVPSHDGRLTLHEMNSVAQSNAFGPRTSFMNLALKSSFSGGRQSDLRLSASSTGEMPTSMANPLRIPPTGNLGSVPEFDLESQCTESTTSEAGGAGTSSAVKGGTSSYVKQMGATLSRGLFQKPAAKSAFAEADMRELATNRSSQTLLPSKTSTEQQTGDGDGLRPPLSSKSALFGNDSRGAKSPVKTVVHKDIL